MTFGYRLAAEYGDDGKGKYLETLETGMDYDEFLSHLTSKFVGP